MTKSIPTTTATTTNNAITSVVVPYYTNSQERLNYVVQCLSQSCPWTKSITAKQMVSWLKSEVLELEEELNLCSSSTTMNHRKKELVSEMGDILFDVIMLEMILRRDYYPNINNVPNNNNNEEDDAWLSACEKIERRTPYMKEWGDGKSVATTVEEANILWQAAKKKEKEQTNNNNNKEQPQKSSTIIVPFILRPIRNTLPSLLLLFGNNPPSRHTILLSSTISFVAGALLSKFIFSSSSTHRMK